MIFEADSGLDLALTYLVASAVVGSIVALCVKRSPGRSLRRTVIGGALLAVAGLLVIASLGAMLEVQLRLPEVGPGILGAQWPSWLTALVFALLGLYLVWPLGGGIPPSRERLTRRQVVGVATAILLATAIAMFLLPVLDWHYGWNGYHGHTYPGRGFHFH